MRRFWTDGEKALMVDLYRKLGDGHAAASEFTRNTGVTISREQLYGVVTRNGGTQIRPQITPSAPRVDEPSLPSRWQDYAPPMDWSAPAPTKAAKDVPAKVEKRLIVPDTHVPAHCRKAWSVLLGVAADWNPDSVIIMGDFLEMEALSTHPKKGPDRSRLAAEYHEGNLALDELQGATPSASWTYLEGNHCARTHKFTNETQDGSLDGLLDVPTALYMRAPEYHRANPTLRGIEWVPLSKQTHVIGSVGYLHGVFEGANACRDHAVMEAPRRGVKHIVFGHLHSINFASAKTGADAWCCGFLGDESRAEFSYTKGRPTGWRQGFLLQEVCGDMVQTTPVYIEGGRAIFGGKLYAPEGACS